MAFKSEVFMWRESATEVQRASKSSRTVGDRASLGTSRDSDTIEWRGVRRETTDEERERGEGEREGEETGAGERSEGESSANKGAY